MFNLIVGFTSNRASMDRMLKYTSDAVKASVSPDGTPDVSRLMALPTIVMPEVGDSEVRQVAKIGRVSELRHVGDDYKFRFTSDREIPSSDIVRLADELEIGKWELSHTHWAVKDLDVYRVLFEHLEEQGVPEAPKVFTFPEQPREDDLVAVMMPFHPGFNKVYETLDSAAALAGMRCQRADNIWENDAIIDDIASLIWRSRIVIADVTGKNANVFYETGIAHTIGRDVILTTQNKDDVPFDLQRLRYISYFPNDQGLGELLENVTGRIKSLIRVR